MNFTWKLPDMKQRQADYIMGPRGSNGANEKEMHIIFLFEPRLLRWAMWPMGLLFPIETRLQIVYPLWPLWIIIVVNLNLHYVRKLSRKPVLSWQRKIFKWLHSFFFSFFFVYLWLFPFEEEPVLYLNKLEFASPKNDFYQLWLKLVCWIWRRFWNIITKCASGASKLVSY
jgi:hypothetical protein